MMSASGKLLLFKASPSDFVLSRWQEEAVVFVRRTGQTNYLNHIAFTALQILSERCMDEAALTQHLVAAGLSGSEATPAARAILDNFLELGLVRLCA